VLEEEWSGGIVVLHGYVHVCDLRKANSRADGAVDSESGGREVP
jgi:hypothetical protein